MDPSINNKNGLFYKILPDIIAILFLAAAGWKLLHDVGARFDLPLNDEAFYIYRGLQIPVTGWHHSDWGMLYSLWYWILSFVVQDPVHLFYLNFKITAVLPPMLFYLLLRKNKVQTVTALLITWMLMISLVNLMTIPRVTHLGLILLITPLLFLNPEKKMLISGWFLMFFLLLASYIRPEFMLAAMLAIGFMGYHSIRKYRLYNPGLLISGWVLIFAVIIILAHFFSLPWIMDDSHRGFCALCQHFAYNYASWNQGIDNSWYQTNEIIQKVFGQAHSYSDLITANPVMLLKHMCYNGLLFIKYLFGILFIHDNLIFSDRLRSGMLIEGFLMFTGFAGWIIWTTRNNWDLIKRNFRTNRKLFLLFIFIGLPTVIGSVVIYPRWHYMIVVVYFFLAFISILIFSRNRKNRDLKTLLLAGCIIYLFTHSISSAWFDTSGKIKQTAIRQEIKKVVAEVKNNADKSKKDHFILDSGTGIGIYLMPYIQPVYNYQKTVNLSNFLLGNRIDMVLMDASFKYSPAYMIFPAEWDDFKTYPCKYGFKIKAMNISGYTLYELDSMIYN